MYLTPPSGIMVGVTTAEKRWLVRRREAPVTSEKEKNKALVRRFVEAQWEKDLDALEEMMGPDFVDHSVLPGQGTTREDFLQDVAEDQAASSDAQLSIEDQMAEDDKVMTRLAIHGSHDQEMFTGVPPTGAELKFRHHYQPRGRWQDSRRVERGHVCVRARPAAA